VERERRRVGDEFPEAQVFYDEAINSPAWAYEGMKLLRSFILRCLEEWLGDILMLKLGDEKHGRGEGGEGGERRDRDGAWHTMDFEDMSCEPVFWGKGRA
jgi:hypothetical protein